MSATGGGAKIGTAARNTNDGQSNKDTSGARAAHGLSSTGATLSARIAAGTNSDGPDAGRKSRTTAGARSGSPDKNRASSPSKRRTKGGAMGSGTAFASSLGSTSNMDGEEDGGGSIGTSAAGTKIVDGMNLYWNEDADSVAELKIKTIKAGNSVNFPKFGDSVCVQYEAFLTDGTLFDSSYRRNQPLYFKLGSGQVISAFEFALPTMSRGQKIRMTVPPHMAYGDEGYPPIIPARATLKYELELITYANAAAVATTTTDDVGQKTTAPGGTANSSPASKSTATADSRFSTELYQR